MLEVNYPKFIIESIPTYQPVNESSIYKIEHQLRNNKEVTEEDTIKLLDYIVYKARNIMLKNKDFKTYSFANQCDLTQSVIGYPLKRMGLSIDVVDTKEALGPKVLQHSILIIHFKTATIQKSYLIDITYRQFCLTEYCNKERYLKKGEQIIVAPDPGYFMMQNSDCQNIIHTLLKQGYIEWTNENAKLYCDTFYQSKTGIPKELKTGKYYKSAFQKNQVTYIKTEQQLKEENMFIVTPYEQHELLLQEKTMLTQHVNMEKRI